MNIEKRVPEFKRELLDEVLAMLTEKQRAGYDRLFPHGMPDNKICDAIDLCERTIRASAAREACKKVGL